MKLTRLFIATALVGACQSTQTSAPPPAASTADPNRQPPAGPAAVASETAPASSPTVSAPAEAKPSTPGKWSFDSDRAEGPPPGFSFGRTGNGKAGQWIVRAVADAPSPPNVLAQIDADS